MKRELFVRDETIIRDWFSDLELDTIFHSWKDLEERAKLLISKGYDWIISADNPQKLRIGYLFVNKKSNKEVLLSISILAIKRSDWIEQKTGKLFASANGKVAIIRSFYE